MDVLFFTFSLRGGGSAAVIKKLATHFSKDLTVHICTLEAPIEDWPENINIHLIHIKKYRLLTSLLNYLQIISKLRAIIIKLKPFKLVSFIHIANMISVISAWKTHTHVIVCERSDLKKAKIGNLWKIARPFIYNFADQVCLQNRADLDHLPKFLAKKIVFARNPISDPKTTKDKLPIIVTVGRLHPTKRHRLLIEICKPVLEQFPKYQLHIYGEGPLLEEIKSQISRTGLCDKVILKGQQNDIPEILSQSTAFVLCSSSEGQPNALLEALASGLPAICFDTSPCFNEIAESFSNLKLIEEGKKSLFSESLKELIISNKSYVSNEWIGWNVLAWSEWEKIILKVE